MLKEILIATVSILPLALSTDCKGGASIANFMLKATCKGEYCDLAYKGDVTNTGSGKDHVTVFMQGIDWEGFQVSLVTLSATLDQGQTKTVTDSSMVRWSEYQQVKKWAERP